MNLYLRLLLRIMRLPQRGQFAESRVGNSEVVAAAGYNGGAPALPEELRLWAEFGNVKKQRTSGK